MFKRRQSKVFWGQMEDQDLAKVNSRWQDVNHGYYEKQLECIAECDSTTDGENNTTVIFRPKSPEQAKERSFCHLSFRISYSSRKSIDSTDSTPCSLSPAILNGNPGKSLTRSVKTPCSGDRGQCSHDSGFSDSDSCSSGRQSLERHKRRRGSKKKAGGGENLEISTEKVVGPAHTSTPKKDLQELPKKLKFDLEESESEFRMNQIDQKPESLDDFLFVSEPPIQPLNELKIDPPVQVWLKDVGFQVSEEFSEIEVKSLPKRQCDYRKYITEDSLNRDLNLLTVSATTAATRLLDKAKRFDDCYQDLINSITESRTDQITQELLNCFQNEAANILVELGISPPRRISSTENSRNLGLQMTRIKHIVDRATDNRLDFFIERVVRGLEDAPRENSSAARGALAALTALGLRGSRAGSSIARCAGVRALLTLLISSQRLTSQLRSDCLRALGSVCCCLDAVDSFVEEGGPEILADILAAPNEPITEKSEATALLVQLISPWMDHAGLPHMEPFAELLVPSVTDLAENSTCSQTLLLAAAALNYLSLSKRCAITVIRAETVKRLLRCVKRSGKGSVFLMEQVASMISQLAKDPRIRQHLADSRASVALICFLRMQPPGLEESCRRLVQITTEALTRLCVDAEVANQVVAVGGSDLLPADQMAEVDGGGLARDTKSLRVARRIAAEQIVIARIRDENFGQSM